MNKRIFTTIFILVTINFLIAGSVFAVTRDQAIVSAASFSQMIWYCDQENVIGCDWNGCPAVGSDFVAGNWYTGVPYKWGGFNTAADHYPNLADGYHAGTAEYECVASCATGLDCSGFVSRCWGRGDNFKLSTSMIPYVCSSITQPELTFGDAINDAGHHVALFDHLASNGNPIVYEATPPLTGIFERPWSYFSGYSFFRYNKMTSDGKAVRLKSGLNLPDSPIIASSSLDDHNFEADFTIRNYGAGSVTIEQVTMAIQYGDGGDYIELESFYDLTLAAEGEFAYPQATCSIMTEGNYVAVAQYKIDGVWYDIPPYEPGTTGRQFFQVFSDSPVDLLDFQLVQSSDFNTLVWSTSTEQDNAGWNLYRAQGGSSGEYTQINSSLILPNQYEYEFVDQEINNDSEYCYKLEAISLFDAVQTFGPECTLLNDDDDDDNDDDNFSGADDDDDDSGGCCG